MSAEYKSSRGFEPRPLSKWVIRTLAAGAILVGAGMVVSEYESPSKSPALSEELVIGGFLVCAAAAAEAVQEGRRYWSSLGLQRELDLEYELRVANAREDGIASLKPENPPQA